jgi:hypothetical protein
MGIFTFHSTKNKRMIVKIKGIAASFKKGGFIVGQISDKK